MNFTESQKNAVDSRGRAILVSAGAGAGKTFVLVQRLMGFITNPVNPKNIDEFLLITYTRAAAAEMRSRIAKAIRDQLKNDPSNTHLKRQSVRLQSAHIQTLHSYCLDLLREFSALTDIPANARVADDAELSVIRERAMNTALESLYEEIGKTKESLDFKAFADAFSDMKGDSNVVNQINSLRDALQHSTYDSLWRIKELERSGDVNYWQGLVLNYTKNLVDMWNDLFGQALEIIENGELYEFYGEKFASDASALRDLSQALNDGWDSVCACLRFYTFDNLKGVKKIVDTDIKDDILALRGEWKKTVASLKNIFALDTKQNAEDLKNTSKLLNGLFYAAERFEKCFAEEKAGIIDFGDIEKGAMSLLKRDNGAVASIVAGRFVEIMVDEYQDINPGQDEIINILFNHGANVLYVGDVRQSIYRFQYACPELFLEKLNDINVQKIELNENFRSNNYVLDAVNNIFSQVMTTEGAGLNYGSPMLLGGNADNCGGKAEIIRVSSNPEEKDILTEARAVAARIAELIANGEARAGDCAVLLSSFRSRAPFYHEALNELNIESTSGVKDEAFFESIPVKAMISFLETIADPTVDVSLLGALRGPGIDFTAEELAHMRTFSNGGLYDCLSADPSPKSIAFLNILNSLRDIAPELPAHRLILRIMELTSIENALDERGCAELDELLHIAANSPDLSLNGFLARLKAMEGGVTVIPPSGKNAVRIMSIHKSKGLQFPVVFLANASKKYNLRDSSEKLLCHRSLGFAIKRRYGSVEYPTVAHNAISLHMNLENKQEEARVLYVALTRAQNRLIVCGMDSPLLSGISINPLKYTIRRANCFMQILSASANPEFWEFSTVSPTVNTVETLPSSITLSDDIIPPVMNTYTVHDNLNTFDLPSKMTVSDLLKDYNADYYTDYNINSNDLNDYEFKNRFMDFEALEDTSFAVVRESAIARGNNIHKAMQYINFANCRSYDGICKELFRSDFLGLFDASSVNPMEIYRFFRSPLGKRVCEADKLYRECKFSMLETASKLLQNVSSEEEILFQGIIDLFFVENDKIIVVDFKSDRLKTGSGIEKAEIYRRQLEAYGSAAERMLGLNNSELHVFFFSTGEDILL